MNVLSKNIEILLLQHDLVMIPGFGGFVVDYKQAQFDDIVNDLILPPARVIVFNKDLNANDGLMVSAYMQNYDANFPQAYRQMELDIEQLVENLNINGFYCLENVGTLRKDLEGRISFEQIHNTAITPALFALAPIHVKSVAQLQNEEDIASDIQKTAILPISGEHDNTNGSLINRRRWRDIAISSAAAVAMFFMFAFPYLKNNQPSDKFIAGATVVQSQTDGQSDEQVSQNEMNHADSENNKSAVNQVVQPQIIVLQSPPSGQNAIIISPEDINHSATINSDDGMFSIVVTPAANEECAQYVIDEMQSQNIPGAFYYERQNEKYVLYSRFNTRVEAMRALNALKPMNKRFRKAWILEMQ